MSLDVILYQVAEDESYGIYLEPEEITELPQHLKKYLKPVYFIEWDLEKIAQFLGLPDYESLIIYGGYGEEIAIEYGSETIDLMKYHRNILRGCLKNRWL